MIKTKLRAIKSFLATNLRLYFLYSRASFSQKGEDLILQKIFPGKRNGFYVDIGAHHPYRYSNTFLLYKKCGWRGINIDADPQTISIFKKTRIA